MTVTDDQLLAAARALRDAATSGTPCVPVRELLGVDGSDVATGYAIQEVNTAHWLAAGRRLVGRKIGLTSAAIQAQLGVDQPDYGMLYDDMVYSDAEPATADAVLQGRAEAEVAFVLGRDLGMERPTLTDVMAAVDHALPAIEVAGSRVADWSVRILDTVADNASSGIFFLGTRPTRLADLDLRRCGMVMTRRGDPVSTGAGAACMGNPLTATVWLARKMVEVGHPLREGDIVLSGALGPMVAVQAGDVLEARISGLGSVRAVFEEAP